MTHQGQSLIDKLQLGGQTLEFSRVALGDGLLPGQGTTLEMVVLTALVHERVSLGIQSIEIITTGRTRVNVWMTNAGLANGITVHEIGLFANDPDLGEILYAYMYAHEHTDYIPPEGGQTAVAQSFGIDTVTGNVAEVTAVFATTAATDVEVKRHFVTALQADGFSTFVLPWAYAPRQPNLAVYVDGVKQIRGVDWNPPTGEEEADTCSTIVFTAAVTGSTKGIEIFSIPVASGAYNRDTVWHKVVDYTCLNSNNDNVITNLGASGPIVFSLDPSISIGTEILFVKEANHDLTIQAALGETIVDSSDGGTLSHTTANQIGANVGLKKTTVNHWTLIGGFGLWQTA